MLPCGSKTVDHARTRIASIESQAEPRPSHHPRVLRASSCFICVEIFIRGAEGRCWRTHCQARVAPHASGATPWHSACMAPVLVAANGCAAFDDVDAYYTLAVSAGLRPEFSPRDDSLGERYFHIFDPEGHELSFARPT